MTDCTSLSREPLNDCTSQNPERGTTCQLGAHAGPHRDLRGYTWGCGCGGKSGLTCDCETRIWSFRVHTKALGAVWCRPVGVTGGNVYFTRKEVFNFRREWAANHPVGPVQRVTAKPWCFDCLAQPCDCGEEIWGLRYRNEGVEGWCDAKSDGRPKGRTRLEAANRRAELTQNTRGTVTYGDVQRLDAQPHYFPPAPPKCEGCQASPCDCKKPIWRWRFRNEEKNIENWIGVPLNTNGYTRERALHLREETAARAAGQKDGLLHGPVQRYTDPHHVFPTRYAKIGNPCGEKPLVCLKCHQETAKCDCTSQAASWETVRLARALFETDPRVIAFVTLVSDCTVTLPSGKVTEAVRYQKAMQTAWTRDENGWRTEAGERAKAIGQWLVRKP